MIKTVSLFKRYRTDGGTVEALSDVSLSVGRGEFLAVTGESGSGKTTLMNLLGCLDRASEGEYYLDGEEVGRLCPGRRTWLRNRKIAFVFQGFNLLPALTAAENAALPLIYRGLSKRVALEKAEEALAMVGLSMRSAHKPAELSGGQQQRVAVARAIAADTPVILADEPCGSLDPRSGLRVMELLHAEHRRGKTVILITHDLAAAKTADRVVRVADGRVEEEGIM
ncbi:MAG: ABC transporter ATP-binding protein [Eubacterium sp.]|nr:ABC transporter ATP-binding protein [Eubacterium sp.]MCM1418806.1 ABC transporter ATP-binding protein [Roseburia sp.]